MKKLKIIIPIVVLVIALGSFGTYMGIKQYKAYKLYHIGDSITQSMNSYNSSIETINKSTDLLTQAANETDQYKRKALIKESAITSFGNANFLKEETPKNLEELKQRNADLDLEHKSLLEENDKTEDVGKSKKIVTKIEKNLEESNKILHILMYNNEL